MQLKEFTKKPRWLDVGTIGLYVSIDQLKLLRRSMNIAKYIMTDISLTEIQVVIDAINERIREVRECEEQE